MSWPPWMSDRAPFETVPQGGPLLTAAQAAERRDLADQRSIERQAAVGAELARRSPTTITAPRLEIKHFEPRSWEVDAAALESLRAKVTAAGLPASREALIGIGQRRFAELLKLNREVRRGDRSVGPSLDLANERATLDMLARRDLLRTPVSPERRLSFKEGPRDEVRRRVSRIETVADLWKSTEPEIRQLTGYYEAFESLRFGHQLVEKYRDGRVYDERFATCLENSTDILAPWLPAFQAPNAQVFLVITLFHLEAAALAWLSGDERLAEDCRLGPELIPSLAKHVFSLRRPGQDELRKTAGLLASVLHPDDIDAGRNDDLFESWERCGRSGARLSLGDIAHLKPYLSSRYLKVLGWQREFLDEALVPAGPYGQFRLDEKHFKHRVESVISDTIAAVFASLALTISAALEGASAQVVGFLNEAVVVEARIKDAQALGAKIDDGLKALARARGLPLVHSIEIANHL